MKWKILENKIDSTRQRKRMKHPEIQHKTEEENEAPRDTAQDRGRE